MVPTIGFFWYNHSMDDLLSVYQVLVPIFHLHDFLQTQNHGDLLAMFEYEECVSGPNENSALLGQPNVGQWDTPKMLSVP